jgi:hypothetical protein
MTDRSLDHERLLAKLLGSPEPELECDECFRLLDVYVEAELAGGGAEEAAPGMAAHLVGCPACSEEHDSLKALLES